MAGVRGAFTLLAVVQVTLIASITLITVALPHLAHDLGLSESDLVLVSSGYGVAFGGLLLLGGAAADRFGHRRALLAGLAVFELGSVAGAAAPSLWPLVLARLAQGVGAALVAPGALGLLGAVYPDRTERDHATALWGVLSSAGATAGMVLGGVLISWASWRWTFAAPIVVGALALALAPRVLPDTPAANTRAIDVTGGVLATAGIAAVLYGTQRSALSIAVGVTLLAAFLVHERRADEPLLPARVVSARAVPLLAIGATAAAMTTSYFLLALYLQQARGFSTLATAAAFALPAPVVFAAGPVSARLIRRAGPRAVLSGGLLLGAGALLVLGRLGSSWLALPVFALGAGLAFSGATVEAIGGAPDAQRGLVAGLVNTAMETGPPIGLAIFVSVASAMPSGRGDPLALTLAAATLAFIVLVAVGGPRVARRHTRRAGYIHNPERTHP